MLYREKHLPPEFQTLITVSCSEGHRFVERTEKEWIKGENRFDQLGECFFLAYWNDLLVGLGGVNRDPYTPDSHIGRIRHLYVHPDFRRRGIARAIIQECIVQAQKHFNILRLRANTRGTASTLFYETLGFRPSTNDQFETHRMILMEKSPTQGHL